MNTGGVEEPGSTPPDDTKSIELFVPEDVLGIGTGSDILIVDDSDTNLVAYEAALAPLGRKLVLARSGNDALKELLDADFALVLLDFSMPGITGIETARMVRSRPRSRGTPILFISGASPSSEAVLEAFEVGAMDFISKPIQPDVLRAKVSVYLRLQERTALLLKQAAVLRDAHQRLAHAAAAERERDAATSTALRLERLQEITTALGDTRTPEQVASVVVRSGALAVNADAAGMWITNADGSLSLAASHGVPDEFVDAWRTIASDADVPVVQVMRTQEPMWAENEDDYARLAPAIIAHARAANRVNAFAVVPLLVDGRVIGVAAFTFSGAHAFTIEERRFLFALVRASEQALERARLHVAEATARAAAELANRRKDEFLAMLGHELRNPLAAIASAVELVRMRGVGLERETSILGRQLGQLTHIVDDLLDVSRITRGLITLRREAVSLRDAVDQALEMLEPETTRLGHQLAIDVPPGALVDADRNRLIQVIFNLVSNAVKYTPAPGRIDVTAEPTPDFVTISVRDNGRGISPALLSDMFELFVQGERALDRREGGLGIGLTLVRTLVHLHGGTIEVSSDGDGKGATFTLQWPRAARQTLTQELPVLAAQTQPSAKSLRVLVVDDNADAAEMLAMVVESMGHVVDVAHDGEAALERAEASTPDVVLLDVGLPELDGYEVASRLRALPGCGGTVLVAVTGYGAPEDFARSQRAGFAEHIVKPIEPARLRSVLENFARAKS